MSNNELVLLTNAALKAASALVQDRASALEIAREAIVKLPGTYSGAITYTPKGCRSRVIWSRQHQLQRLVMAAAERYEIRQERLGTVTQEDMIVRYIERIIRMAMRHNSFWAMTGIACVLHDYSSAEALDMYMTVAPNRALKKYDGYGRVIRARFMEELKKRFPGLLEPMPGPRGKNHFRAVADTDQYQRVVDKTLDMLAPWGTECALPGGCGRDTPPNLIWNGNPDEEHVIEARRYHAIIEPLCFGRLTKAWGLDGPGSHRVIPWFQLDGGSPRRPGGDSAAPDDAGTGTEEPDINNLIEEIKREWQRRSHVFADAVSVVIDGQQCARIARNSSAGARLELTEPPERIEIVAEIGDRPVIATYFAPCDEEDERPTRSHIEHRVGDAIISIIFLQPGSQGSVATTDVTYTDTGHYQHEALAIRLLRDAEVAKLKISAGFRSRPVGDKLAGRTHEDLFAEALIKTLDGSRRWNEQVDPFAHLSMVIRGLANDWREKKFAEMHPENFPLAVDYASTEPTAERQLLAHEALEKIRARLAEDDTALKILDLLTVEAPPDEIRAELDLPASQYYVAMKRIRRAARAAGLG